MINLYKTNIKSWFDKIKFSNQKILYNKTFTGYVVKRFERGEQSIRKSPMEQWINVDVKACIILNKKITFT